jgi:hypothetical protein
VSVYDKNGHKHESKITKTGAFENPDVYQLLAFFNDIVSRLAEDGFNAREVCGNCKYNEYGFCVKDEALNYNTPVADFEEKCEEFKWA